MKIGLIDVDGHNFPNIPLMKISAYHKAKGDEVSWYEPLFSGKMDRVYMSKVFSFTPDYEYCIDADEVIKGGSGYSKRLKNSKTTIQTRRKENNKMAKGKKKNKRPEYVVICREFNRAAARIEISVIEDGVTDHLLTRLIKNHEFDTHKRYFLTLKKDYQIYGALFKKQIETMDIKNNKRIVELGVEL